MGRTIARRLEQAWQQQVRRNWIALHEAGNRFAGAGDGRVAGRRYAPDGRLSEEEHGLGTQP